MIEVNVRHYVFLEMSDWIESFYKIIQFEFNWLQKWFYTFFFLNGSVFFIWFGFASWSMRTLIYNFSFKSLKHT